MTKAKARERAKAKTLQKAIKRKANAGQAAEQTRPGQFDPGSASISSPGAKASTRNTAGGPRKSARSR